MRRVKPEALLAKRVSNYLLYNHPDVPFRFDQIDQVGKRGGSRNKELHGRWSRGYPDLFIAAPKLSKKGKIKACGLFLELKATSKVPDTAHTREQRAFHEVLRKLHYMVDFCCGFEDCVKKIQKYLIH